MTIYANNMITIHKQHIYPGKYIAREKIDCGDIITIVWQKKFRRAKAGDSKDLFVSVKNYKKGEQVTDVSLGSQQNYEEYSKTSKEV